MDERQALVEQLNRVIDKMTYKEDLLAVIQYAAERVDRRRGGDG